MTSDPDHHPDDHHSWFVAIVGTFAMVFTFGTPYSYGVFLTPFSELYGLSSVTLSTVFSIQLFVFYVGAGLIGVYATRLQSRRVILACGVVAGILAPSLYLVDSYTGLVVVFGLLGAALGTVFVVLASIVPQWFDDQRGLATGVLFAGNGLSLFVVPPAWQFAFDRVGVQRGFFIVVLASAGAFLLAGTVTRRPPWANRSTASMAELWTWLLRQSGTRQFQFLFVGVGLSFAWYYVLAAFAIDLFQTRGLTTAGASIVFGLVGGVSIVSRLGSGAVADRVGHVRTLLVALGCATIGSVVLLVPNVYALGLAVFSLGIGLGGVAALYIPVILGTYSSDMDTAVVGVFNVACGIFALIAPPVGTALVAYTGSYDDVIVLTVVATLGAIGTIRLGTSAMN